MVSRFFNSWTVAAVLAACLLGIADDLGHAAKAKPKGRSPDFKILSVDAASLKKNPNGAPLTLTIRVELPKVMQEEMLLDVSTLITSTSRSSFALLSSRQMLPTIDDTTEEAQRQLEIVQTWDGTDNNDRIVVEGMYDYQVQAKLMVMNKDGYPMTRLSAWKKRGTLEVKAAADSE